jgi:hypothetical protein
MMIKGMFGLVVLAKKADIRKIKAMSCEKSCYEL